MACVQFLGNLIHFLQFYGGCLYFLDGRKDLVTGKNEVKDPDNSGKSTVCIHLQSVWCPMSSKWP